MARSKAILRPPARGIGFFPASTADCPVRFGQFNELVN
jgi:hypothetical protein